MYKIHVNWLLLLLVLNLINYPLSMIFFLLTSTNKWQLSTSWGLCLLCFIGVRVTRSFVFCVVFCRSLFQLAILLSFLPRFTDFDYPFVNFKLIFDKLWMTQSKFGVINRFIVFQMCGLKWNFQWNDENHQGNTILIISYLKKCELKLNYCQ